jgi:hypothetical protein
MGDDDDDDYDAVSPPSLKLQYVTYWVTDQIHIEMGVIDLSFSLTVSLRSS